MGWCCCNKKSGMGAGAMFVIFMPVWIGIITNSNPKKDFDAQISVGSQVAIKEKMMNSKDVLGYEFEMLDGTNKSLEDYRGSVVMFVNVASACGLTPQYEGLEALYQEKKGEGFVIVGFPANEFGGQEPGSNTEIAEFCSVEYGVSFPMAGKIVVKGEGVHPLYAQLAGQPEPIGGEPEWNFAKFLVNREGEVVARFPSRTPPEDAGLVALVDELLGG